MPAEVGTHIAFVQFEPDGRLRRAGAFAPAWLAFAKDTGVDIERQRISLAEMGGHYPVMTMVGGVGSAAPLTDMIDHRFRPVGPLSPEDADGIRATTAQLAKRTRRPGLPAPGRQFCAVVGCVRSASFEKPLCYPHWRRWDAHEMLECSNCHWVVDLDSPPIRYFEADFPDDVPFMCNECMTTDESPSAILSLRPQHTPESPVALAHAPLVHQVRYVYVLGLDGGEMYVGQTVDLAIRVKEHSMGTQRQTRGKNPRLLYYEVCEGDRDKVAGREEELTVLNQSPIGRRRIRELIEEWQAPLRLVDLS